MVRDCNKKRRFYGKVYMSERKMYVKIGIFTVYKRQLF